MWKALIKTKRAKILIAIFATFIVAWVGTIVTEYINNSIEASQLQIGVSEVAKLKELAKASDTSYEDIKELVKVVHYWDQQLPNCAKGFYSKNCPLGAESVYKYCWHGHFKANTTVKLGYILKHMYDLTAFSGTASKGILELYFIWPEDMRKPIDKNKDRMKDWVTKYLPLAMDDYSPILLD